MELYAYAVELFGKKRARPTDDLMSVLTQVDVDGEQLSELELELFFLLLTVAGNETTRNLISGGMAAFFDHPDQWDLLRRNRSLLPSAAEEMLRYVSPVMHFRRQTTAGFQLGDQFIEEDSKVVFFHVSANRDEAVFDDPQRFDITRRSQPPHRLRRRRSALLPGRQPRPPGDPDHVRAPARPDAGAAARRPGPALAVAVHQRGQAPPGGLPGGGSAASA